MGIQDIGAFREMMSRVVLKGAGLTPDDVHYVPLASANYIQGLLAGQIDTAVLHVDQALNARQRQAGLHQLVNLWEVLPTYFYGAFIISPDKMRDNPTLATSFVKAVMRAHRFIYANRDKTIEMANKLTNVPPEVLGPAYDQLTAAGVFPVNDGLPAASIDGTIKALHDLGTLQASQNVTSEQLVDRRPAEEAVKALGPMSGDPRWK
jgi:ABC-type nitrate/sulfonate/bicarbonate transport system substrate-binding protein